MGITAITLPILLSVILLVGTMGNALAGNGMQAGSGGDPVPHGPDPINPDPDCAGFINGEIINGGPISEVCVPPKEVIACQPVSSCPPIKKTINSAGINFVSVHEEWIVGAAGPNWSDWHEKIFMSPDWAIVDAFFGITPVGISCNPSFSITPASPSQELWIDFSPALKPGDKLCIWKLLEYTGTAQPSTFMLIEWPTVRSAIGGDIVLLDSTMILVAGTQYTAAWMIPVIVSGIGIAIVIARKF